MCSAKSARLALAAALACAAGCAGTANPGELKCTDPASPGCIPPAEGCVPESDGNFCARLGSDGGALVDTDNCGQPRSVASCGICGIMPELEASVLETAVSTAGGNPAPSATSVSFGSVYCGQTRVIPVLISNKSGASRTVASAAASGSPELTVGRFTPATLENCAASPCPKTSITWITVSWTPSAPGALSGTVVVRDGGGAALLTLPVCGSAVALPNIADVTSSAFAGGARCDSGASDSTAAFRAAAATGKLVFVPAAPCAGGKYYKLTGTVNISGPGVLGEPGGDKPYVRMVGATGLGHTIFVLRNNDAAIPVLFAGLHLDGGWDGVTLPDGEWDHLIELQYAKNVVIENNLLENPVGDCVYVGGDAYANPEWAGPSHNVLISNNTCDNPWRCTVAVTSVNDLRVLNNVLAKPNGGPRGDVWYHFNLDFEPDPFPTQSTWNAEVAFNEITSHVPPSRYQYDVGIATLLSHASFGLPPDGLAGGNIAIHDNRGSAGTFFVPSGHGNGYDFWRNVSVYRNFNPNGCFPPLGPCP